MPEKQRKCHLSADFMVHTYIPKVTVLILCMKIKHIYSILLVIMYFSLLRYIFIWDACGFYFTDVVCGFSPGREKFCHFLEIGACRVGVSISLCVGLCLVGPLLVGHSFRWRFLIGMGGGVVVRCLSVCIICAFLRGSATWGCCFGYPFISAE